MFSPSAFCFWMHAKLSVTCAVISDMKLLRLLKKKMEHMVTDPGNSCGWRKCEVTDRSGPRGEMNERINSTIVFIRLCAVFTASVSRVPVDLQYKQTNN